MKERAAELRAEKSGGNRKAKDLEAALEALAKLPDEDQAIGERIHAIVTESAPQLDPKTWYGMPAYAADGTVVLYFSPASKFKERYSTLGFNEPAQLDDGDMWPTSYAVTRITDEVVARITELVQRAAG